MAVLESFLGTFLGSTLAWAAIIWLLKAWLSSRLTESIKAEYARQFEQLRNEFARQMEIEAVANGAFSAAHVAAHTRRLDAVEKLWSAVQLPLAEGPPFISVIDSATTDKLQEYAQTKFIVDSARQFQATDVVNLIAKSTQLVEPVRPYLGEDVYRLFFYYRAFISTFLMCVVDIPEKGSFPLWQESSSSRNALGKVLEPNELEELCAQRFAGWAVARDAMQQKILAATADLISGRRAGKAGLMGAVEIRELAAQAAIKAEMENKPRN